MEKALSVDPEEWRREVPQITKCFQKFRETLSSTLWDELESLTSRLA